MSELTEDQTECRRMRRHPLAITIRAAVWLDRYGSQGAPDRLRDLAAALAGRGA